MRRHRLPPDNRVRWNEEEEQRIYNSGKWYTPLEVELITRSMMEEFDESVEYMKASGIAMGTSYKHWSRDPTYDICKRKRKIR